MRQGRIIKSINAVKSDWDVPADEPWPTDCQPTATSNTSPDNSPDALYKASSRSIVKGVVESLASLQELFVSVDPYDQMWVLDVAGELLTFRDAYSEVQKLTPPSSLKIAHETLLSSLKILSDVSYSLPKAFDSGNTNEIEKQAQRMWDSLEGIDSFTAMTN